MVFLAWLLAPTRAQAANDPRLDYWTIETDHFHIHYEKRLEPVAERVAALSEAIHDQLVGPLGYVPDEVTEVAITDTTDSANGSATALPYNTVRLFVTAPGDLSPLADTDDWYLGLMTHEYTHILHIDNVSGVPTLINAILGKTYTPNQIQPRWIIEGLAVVAESAFTSAGRIRSSVFDMYLRADFLANNVARLDQISNPARRWPQGNLWYLYGSRFMQWIADVYGPDVFRAVIADFSASLIPWGINRAIRRQTGRTYVQLYEGFKDHMRRHYGRMIREVKRRGLREGKRITFDGRTTSYPQFAPANAGLGEGDQLLFARDNFDDRTGLYRLDLSQQREGVTALPELWARSRHANTFSFGPDGDLYFSSVVPWRRIFQRSDLFHLPAGKEAETGYERHRTQLTSGMRADAPTVSPDGRRAVFVHNDQGTRSLMIADVTPQHRLQNVKALWRGRPFDQAYTPRFSPDGRTVAFSVWRRGGFRDIALLTVEDGTVELLTRDRAVDMQPTFSPDGARVYFSSDRTGIPNIFVKHLESGRVEQVTNVRNGAFMPAIRGDEKQLVYVGYGTEGFDLWSLPIDTSDFLDAGPTRMDRPPKPPDPPPVVMRKHRYNALPTLRPYNYGIEVSEGNFGATAVTLTAGGTDILGLHSIDASVLIDPEAPLPQGTLGYTYGRLPFDVDVTLSNRTTPRSDFRFNDANVEYVEKSYRLRSGLSYQHLGEFNTQRIGVAYSLNYLDAELPFAQAGTLDPYAAPTVEPLRGVLSTVSLGYVFTNAESSFDAVGAPRGYTLRLRLEAGDEFTASQDSFYRVDGSVTGYFEMPWGYRHTLALATAGGMSRGSFARRGTFFVGGFNLENLDVIDTLTGSAQSGGFILRGYEPGSYRGANYILQNVEYRIPIAYPDWGPSTLPLYVRRLDANLFFDWGGAFDRVDFDEIGWFQNGSILDVPFMHSSVGAEAWLGWTVGYGLNLETRLGYAYGFSDQAAKGGRAYFLAASSF